MPRNKSATPGATELDTDHLPAKATFHQVDCVEGMERLLEPGSADVVVTSPPYNLGIAYGRHDDTAPRDEYLEWCDRWARGVKRILAEQGSFFLNVGGKPTDPYVPFDVLAVMRRHFVLQNVFHWVKSIAIMQSEVGNYPGLETDLVVGHYKPINSPRFVNDCHEYIFHLTHSGAVPLDRLAVGVPYRDKSNVSRWKSGGHDGHCRGNTWFIPYETIQRRDRDRPHPASFPPALPERCIRVHGVNRTHLVVDPFMGLGSTAVACSRLGVPCAGFEIDEDYISAAQERLALDAAPRRSC
jgi:site-specific DNA-methyltransferase (adenine-specific)